MALSARRMKSHSPSQVTVPWSAWASLLHSLLSAPETLAAPQVLFLDSASVHAVLSRSALFPCSPAGHTLRLTSVPVACFRVFTHKTLPRWPSCTAHCSEMGCFSAPGSGSSQRLQSAWGPAPFRLRRTLAKGLHLLTFSLECI